MEIPILNIYYLLSYAWNKLEEKERVNVSIDDKTSLLDLFAKVIINATKILLKRGIDKNYLDHTEVISGIKGKLQFSQTVKSNILIHQKTICTFDDLSANISTNKILVTSILRLVHTKGLDIGLKRELVSLQRMLPHIEIIELSSPLFRQIKLNRNNNFHGFILNICELIYESTLPSEEHGKFSFSDFTRDENKMNILFEAFIRNFYRIEQTKYPTIKRENIQWRFNSSGIVDLSYLPIMQTDITLENETNKIIIDAKYYRETMKLNYNKEKLESSNLYQLFSYLLNQEKDDVKSLQSIGILLYPTVQKDLDLDYNYKDHLIKIRTVNLNTHWKNISSRLKEIVDC